MVEQIGIPPKIVITDSPTAEPASPGVVVVRPGSAGQRKIIKFRRGAASRSFEKKRAFMSRARERRTAARNRQLLRESRLRKARSQVEAAKRGEQVIGLSTLVVEKKISPEQASLLRQQDIQSRMLTGRGVSRTHFEPQFKEVKSFEVIETEKEFRELGVLESLRILLLLKLQHLSQFK